MTEDGQPLGPEHYELMSNAGRCDWCGKTVDMDSGDEMVIAAEEEFGNEEAGVCPQLAAHAVADALERIGGPKDAMLADVLRESPSYRLHGRCFDESALSDLHQPIEGGGEDAQ